MRVRLRLPALAICLVPLAPTATIAPAPAEGASPPQCAQVTTTATTPDGLPGTPPTSPCWSAVVPYPFGDEGSPVDTSHGARCAPVPPKEEPKQECFLTV